MKIETKTIEQITITGVPRLDPVRVMIEDFELGQGRITITCWDDSWVNYWGSMADRTMSQFFQKASVHYLAGKLGSGTDDQIYDATHIEELCKKQVLKARRGGELTFREARDLHDRIEMETFYDDPAINHDLLSDIFGAEWWHDLPKKPNPRWEYLCRIVSTVKEALALHEASKTAPAAASGPVERRVDRTEDMSARGRLRLFQQTDGDIIVSAQSERDGLIQVGDSVEFCVPGPGGGRSPRTLAALRGLMDAMEADNRENPIKGPDHG